MSKEIKTVNFHGDQLIVIRFEGKIYVPMRRVCDAVGLAWVPQHRKLQEIEWSGGLLEMVTGDAEHGQAELCLDIEFLPMFMAQIHVNKVRESVRPKILKYKEEARKVMADAFLRGEVTTSVDAFAEHPAMREARNHVRLTRDWLIAQEQIRSLELANVRIEGKVEGIAEEQSRMRTEQQRMADTQKQMITRRQGNQPVPEGTITIPRIRSRYLHGVSITNIAFILRGLNWEPVPFTQIINGEEIPSFCYRQAGLQEAIENFVDECAWVKEVPTMLMFRHPYVPKDFGFQKDELSPELEKRLRAKAKGFTVAMDIDDDRDALSLDN